MRINPADSNCDFRFYCIWDSFRAQHPLLSIIDPPAQIEMVRALIDIYRFEGMTPSPIPTPTSPTTPNNP